MTSFRIKLIERLYHINVLLAKYSISHTNSIFRKLKNLTSVAFWEMRFLHHGLTAEFEHIFWVQLGQIRFDQPSQAVVKVDLKNKYNNMVSFDSFPRNIKSTYFVWQLDKRHFSIFTQFEFLLMETWPIFTYDKIIIILKNKKQYGELSKRILEEERQVRSNTKLSEL